MYRLVLCFAAVLCGSLPLAASMFDAQAKPPLRVAIAGLVHGHAGGLFEHALKRTDIQIVGIAEPARASTTLTVSTVQLLSITISPANPHIAKGTSLKFTAVGTYSDCSTATLVNVSWRSSKNNLANMRGNGILHAKKVGTLTVTATLSGVSGPTTVTVGSGTLVSVAITPTNATVSTGATQQFIATGTFSDASTQDVSINSHWSSTVPTVATIANAPVNAGLPTTHAPCTTTIAVNHGGITATGAMLTGN